jgi:hypothetical protein
MNSRRLGRILAVRTLQTRCAQTDLTRVQQQIAAQRQLRNRLSDFNDHEKTPGCLLDASDLKADLSQRQRLAQAIAATDQKIHALQEHLTVATATTRHARQQERIIEIIAETVHATETRAHDRRLENINVTKKNSAGTMFAFSEVKD